jgi:hypothetical protein
LLPVRQPGTRKTPPSRGPTGSATDTRLEPVLRARAEELAPGRVRSTTLPARRCMSATLPLSSSPHARASRRVHAPYLAVKRQLSTLPGTDGNQPGITGKQPNARNPSSRPFQDPHQRHDQRLLPHVQPGDGPTDDHALDLRRALENREARGGTTSFRTHRGSAVKRACWIDPGPAARPPGPAWTLVVAFLVAAGSCRRADRGQAGARSAAPSGAGEDERA